MIEVTDALKASVSELKASIAELVGQMRSGNLSKDMLMKLYGTHAYMAQEQIEPGMKVFFCVVLGLPSLAGREDNAQQIRIRDEMQRITNRIGPSFHGTTNRPVIKVESVASWNDNHVSIKAERLS